MRQATLPEVQTKSSEPTGTVDREQVTEAEGSSVITSAAVVGGQCVGESQQLPPSTASSCTNGSVAGMSAATAPSATVDAPSPCTLAASIPPMQDPEVIKAINVLRKYPDLATISSVGGGMNGTCNGPAHAPAVMASLSGDGGVQQQQQQLPPQQQQQQLPPQQQQQQQLPPQQQQQLPPQQQQQLPPPQQQQLLLPQQQQLLPQQQQQQLLLQQPQQLPTQQSQLPYCSSPAVRSMHYTQLGSALPPSQQPSPYQQRHVMPSFYGGEAVAESHSPHSVGAGMMAGCGPAMHPTSFYYDPRRCYSTRDDGMMAMQSPSAAADASAASYMRRQSSTMVTDEGGYHHSDQLAMYQDRPHRPGGDNYFYVSHRRSTFPSNYTLMCGVTEEVENIKYRYPESMMYASPHSMYGNGMDGGYNHGPYRPMPNGAGSFDNGGRGILPALEWNTFHAPAAGSTNGNVATLARAAEYQPPVAQISKLPSAAPGVGHGAMPLAGSFSHGQPASGSVAVAPAPLGQNPQQPAVTDQPPRPSAVSCCAAVAATASVCTASSTSAVSASGSLEKKVEESSHVAAAAAAASLHAGCAAAADSVDGCTGEVSTSAGDVLPSPRKRPQSSTSETPCKRSAVVPSATKVTRCDSATQAAESSSEGGNSASDRGDSRSAGKKAGKRFPTSVAAEAEHAVHQPLETAALRPRKSCMGSIDGGHYRAVAVDGAADAEPAAEVGPDGVKKKASPTWDVGAIVWARLSGERWWPAMTIEGHMALQKPAEGTNCWVFWYGDHKVSEIPSEKIQWFANNFTQRFSSTGGKVYKKAVAEALQECIRRSGYAEVDQVPVSEDNEHLRSCARQLFEQKGVSAIDTTSGSVTPLVADFLRVIVSRIPSTNSPAASESGASGASKRASAVAGEGDDDDVGTPNKVKAITTGKLAVAASSSSASSNESKSSASSTKPCTPGSKSPAAPKTPSSGAKSSQNSAKKTARASPRSSATTAPPSPAASTSSSCSNSGNSNGVVSSSTNCSGTDEVKAGQGVSRQQYRALHGKQLDDFFNEVRKGKRMLNEVCIACNVHRKPVVVKHPLIEGGLCDTCKHKIMEALFSYGTDGCNVYCVLCGEGGNLLVCELRGCGKTYCQGCIETLGSPALLERCLEASPWSCFTCSEEPIVTTDRVSLIVRRPDWQAHVSGLFEKPNSVLHKGPSANDFMKKKLRVLSLFDGISTGKLVLDQLGFDIEKYYASEIDPDSILVTTKNHADSVIQLGDVRCLTQEKLAALGRIDLVIGGSPCNDLALVNPTRKGIYDGTGVLFFEFYRILQTLNGLQPENNVFWLFENVVCMRVETKEVICRFLECEPVNFNAGYFSAQNRARYFWGNIPGLYTPLNPDILGQDVTLQSVLTPGFDRKANVQKLRTVTTRTASLKQGHKEELLPVTMNGSDSRLWPTELERVFGMPDHYTDVGPMGPTKRQKLLGRAWCVPVVKHLLTPLKQFFLLKEGKETSTEAKP